MLSRYLLTHCNLVLDTSGHDDVYILYIVSIEGEMFSDNSMAYPLLCAAAQQTICMLEKTGATSCGGDYLFEVGLHKSEPLLHDALNISATFFNISQNFGWVSLASTKLQLWTLRLTSSRQACVGIRLAEYLGSCQD